MQITAVDGETVQSVAVDLRTASPQCSYDSNLVSMAWLHDSNTLLVVDAANACIAELKFENAEMTDAPSIHRVLKHSQFDALSSICAWGSTYYVLDAGRDCVHVVEDMRVVRAFGLHGDRPGQLSGAKGISCFPDGRLVVSDTGNNRLQLLSCDGEPLLQIGARGFEDGQFNKPAAVITTSQSNIFVADCANNRFQMFSGATGAHLWSVDQISDEGLFKPVAVGVASDGDLLIADENGMVSSLPWSACAVSVIVNSRVFQSWITDESPASDGSAAALPADEDAASVVNDNVEDNTDDGVGANVPEAEGSVRSWAASHLSSEHRSVERRATEELQAKRPPVPAAAESKVCLCCHIEDGAQCFHCCCCFNTVTGAPLARFTRS